MSADHGHGGHSKNSGGGFLEGFGNAIKSIFGTVNSVIEQISSGVNEILFGGALMGASKSGGGGKGGHHH